MINTASYLLTKCLSEQLVFDPLKDEVVGYVDLGPLGRTNEYANHALVFMLHGLRKSWKQPIAFFFTKNTIKTVELRTLIKNVIITVEDVGFCVLATVCDQGPTNRSAIFQLSQESDRPGPYFNINQHKVFTIFDPPHLLKSTRNAFMKYDIKSKDQVAKFSHIRQCYKFDQQRKFQAMRKIREVYLYLNDHNRLKMKVCVAARTLSQTVASAIESMIASGSSGCSGGFLPPEAMHTAQFVHDMDNLFDSLNGNSPRGEMGKPYRRCLSKNSPHLRLWDELLPKINSWIFVNGDTKKNKMPFKNGWLTTLNAIKGLWGVCQELGFNFLRTKALNQDSLENSFAGIRHFGAQNTNPNAYQFISSFKTTVLNNLITPQCNRNCESDENSILDNLQNFLESDATIVPLIDLEPNELLSINIPDFPADFSIAEQHTLSYVAGYLVKKLKSRNTCEECAANLTTDQLGSEHLFSIFKEYTDNKKRLTYVSKNILLTLGHIHSLITFVLPKYGYISHLSKKVNLLLKEHISFSWYTCDEHANLITSEFLSISTKLIIRKYYDDIYRQFQKDRSKKKN